MTASETEERDNRWDELTQLLLDLGVTLAAGVPCALLSRAIESLTRLGMYVPAANEGTALATAAGASLAGGRGAVLAQNSGLGNLINPLSSVLLPGGIPVLTVLSLRGYPDPDGDEPQHAVMGRTTHALLDTLGVVYRNMPSTAESMELVTAEVDAVLSAGRPCFLLVEHGTTTPVSLRAVAEERARWTRNDAISTIARHLGTSYVYATTGYISRELFGIHDRDRNYYVQGGMGHALSLALGTALTQPAETVLALDGDGAILMHLGAAATVGAVQPSNLVHVVIDNGRYESTGGQASTSESLRWAELARGLGYRSNAVCESSHHLGSAVRTAFATCGPHLVVARVSTGGTVVPPRASSAISLPDLGTRFTTAVRGGTG